MTERCDGLASSWLHFGFFLDRFSGAVGRLSAPESPQLDEVIAGRKHRIGGLLLVLAVAACATRSPDNSLPVHSPSPQDPRDLALHIIEVNPDGKGDEVNREKVVSIEKANYPLTEHEHEKSDIKICEDAINLKSSADTLRNQFKCVIQNAIKKYQNWTDLESDGRLCQNENRRDSCKGKPLKLVFYFNGGLNKKSVVTATAGSSYREIEYDSMYPVYMIWPTGGRQSYGEDVARVRAGRLTKWSKWSTLVSTPVRPVSDLLRGIASAPAAWATSLHEFSQTTFDSESYMMKRDRKMHVSEGKPIANGETFTIRPNRNLYFTPWEQEFQGPKADAPPDGEPEADLRVQDGGAELASFAYHAATAPVRVLTTLPMVGLGEAGWRNMVRRTRTSVRATDEFDNQFAEEAEAAPGSEDDPNSVEIARVVGAGRPHRDSCKDHGENPNWLRSCFPRGSGGFARVFQWLESCMRGREGLIERDADGCPLENLQEADRKTLRNARIVMIGHSMGAIVVNELLQLFPDLPYESLVYMAGAASVRDTSRAVAPLLERNRGCTKFYGLMLHPMNEARESNGFGLLPSGSLLVWVDEFLEVPKTVPDRTVGQWRNLRATRHVFFPEKARQWMLFHVFDRAAGLRPLGNSKVYYHNPTTHGSFNDERVPFWKEAFWKPEGVVFLKTDADCEDVFAGKTRTTELTTEATMQEWQSVLQEVARGRTIAITRRGETIARIVPVPEKDQQDNTKWQSALGFVNDNR